MWQRLIGEARKQPASLYLNLVAAAGGGIAAIYSIIADGSFSVLALLGILIALSSTGGILASQREAERSHRLRVRLEHYIYSRTPEGMAFFAAHPDRPIDPYAWHPDPTTPDTDK